jgi:hypothetical protein
VTGEPRVGHEAARLLAAAQDWLRTSAPHLAPVDESGESCSCPLCRVVASVREADPDAVGQWVDAAVAAATQVLAAASTRVGEGAESGSTAAGADAEADEEAVAALRVVDGEPTGERGDDGPPATDPTSTGVPADGATGQDGERGRRVRSIPVEREPGDPAR